MSHDYKTICGGVSRIVCLWLCCVCFHGILVTAVATTNKPVAAAIPAFKSISQAAANAPIIPTTQRVEVMFAWESSVGAAAYRLKWGAVSGSYTNHVVGSGLTNTLSLQVGVTYYVAATSLDAVGNESKPSNEVTITPQLVYRTFLVGSVDLVTWKDICEVQTTNAAQMLRLESRPVNLAN